MNELGGDFQQSGCLYNLISGIQWTPEHLWMSDKPQKQASETSFRKSRSVNFRQWCYGD